MPKSRFIDGSERLQRIEVAMKRNDLSWNRLAKKMRMSAGSVYKAFHINNETGKYRDVRVSTIKKMARALGTTAGFLVDRKDI